MKSLVDETDGS